MIQKTLTALAATAAIAIAVTAALPGRALAQTEAAGAGGIAMELNSLRTVETGCRLAFVVTNETGTGLEAASYDFAIFDADGAVDRTLVFRFGALPAGKTKVMQYDLSEMSCDNIGRVLVNSVTECTAEGGGEAECLSGLATSTRADVNFGL